MTLPWDRPPVATRPVPGWWAEFNAAFNLAVSPTVGIKTSTQIALALTPSAAFVGAEHYARTLGLSVTPSVVPTGSTRNPAAFSLGVTPVISIGQGYKGIFGLSVSTSLGMAGAEHYARSVSVNAGSPFTTMNAAEHYARTVSLSVTPAITATGIERDAAAVGISVTPSLAMTGGGHNGGPTISYINGAAAAATTLTMPTHQAGDLLLAYAFRDGSATSAAMPVSNWTWQWTSASTASPCCLTQTARVCTSNAESLGTVTSATGLAVALYRRSVSNAEWVLAPDGPWVSNGSTTSTIAFPASDLEPNIIPAIPDHWYVRTAGHRTATDLTTTQLAGWSSRVGVATELRLIDTGTEVTTNDAELIGDNSFVVNATSGWASMTAFVGLRLITGMPLFVGSFGVSGSTSVSPMPAHQAGDLLIATAYINGSTTAPSLPAGWTNIQSGGANTNAMRTGYKIAASSSETSGTWTGAGQVAIEVWRNAGIGVSALGGSTGSTITYPALTLSTLSGSSRTYLIAAHRTATDVALNPQLVGNGATYNPGGGVTGGVGLYHSQTGWTANQAAQTQTVNASSGWRAHSVEITYAP